MSVDDHGNSIDNFSPTQTERSKAQEERIEKLEFENAALKKLLECPEVKLKLDPCGDVIAFVGIDPVGSARKSFDGRWAGYDIFQDCIIENVTRAEDVMMAVDNSWRELCGESTRRRNERVTMSVLWGRG